MKRLILSSLCVLFFSGTALAHWNPGDPNKWVQLPDPTGWDIRFDSQWSQWVADDWLCTETGPVSDIHFWYSWENDNVDLISAVNVRIYSDNPDTDGDGPGYSKPGTLLRQWQFRAEDNEFTSRWYGDGSQGWYEPYCGPSNYPDHNDYYQINIVDIVDIVDEPFVQDEGTIYWLSLLVDIDDDNNHNIGWKTSQDKWNDDAVYWSSTTGGWVELHEPVSPYESLDLAFVITPEPATIVLLGFGSLALLRRKASAKTN